MLCDARASHAVIEILPARTLSKVECSGGFRGMFYIGFDMVLMLRVKCG